MQQTIVQRLAILITARLNCIESKNEIWQGAHEYSIKEILKDRLPSGSGIDGETTIDYAKSKSDRIVIKSSYHVINEVGFYKGGWIDYRVIITPSLQFGFELNIVGNFSAKKQLGLRDYLYEVYEHALSTVL